MGWFFSSGDDDDIFSGSFNLGDLIGDLFGGSIFGSLFGEREPAENYSNFYETRNTAPRLSTREQKFYEKIKIVVGEDTEQINPESFSYEAHKLRMVFELEDEMLFADLNEYEFEQKKNERISFLRENDLCEHCCERLDEGLCPCCNPSE